MYMVKWLVHPIKRRLAKYYLVLLKGLFGLKVIAITGSAGKTTTKEMVASILKLSGKTVYSYANIDPVYNIPTTILRCSPRTKYLILEMGVEYPGEMDFYLWLAKVDIGLITNIYPTHTEFFRDARGVFEEKRKLAYSLKPNDLCILNNEDTFLLTLKNKLKCKTVWFGHGGELSSQNVKIDREGATSFDCVFDEKPKKEISITIPVLGTQFVDNALAAMGVAMMLKIPTEKIKQGLEGFTPTKHRMLPLKHKSGALILDDSYNNNPFAALAALKTMKNISSKNERKVIVFGDMLELGELEKKYHQLLGEKIARLKPAKLICIGKASFETAFVASKILGEKKVSFFSSWKGARHELKEELKENTLILVKGSRSLGLENLVSALF